MAAAVTEIRVVVTGVSLRCTACGTAVTIDGGDWRGRVNLWAMSHRAPQIDSVHTNAGTWANRG